MLKNPVPPVDNETIKGRPIFLLKIIIHDRRLPFDPGSLFWRQLFELTLYLTCTDLGMKSGLLTEVTPRLSVQHVTDRHSLCLAVRHSCYTSLSRRVSLALRAPTLSTKAKLTSTQEKLDGKRLVML